MRKLTTFATLALTTTALTGCTDMTTVDHGSIAGAPKAGSSGSDGTVPAAPRALYTGTCDYDLGETFDDDYTMSAEVEVENTGNVDIKVQVTAGWPQFGHLPVSASKTVTVPYQKKVTVRFAKHASQVQIERLQSYQMKHADDGDICSYRGTITKTVGTAH